LAPASLFASDWSNRALVDLKNNACVSYNIVNAAVLM
jgi:hypothetical protein